MSWGEPVIHKYGDAARFDVNFITTSSLFFVKAASHHLMITFSFSRLIQNKEAFRKKRSPASKPIFKFWFTNIKKFDILSIEKRSCYDVDTK